jgi:hypothetical protein
MQLRLIIGGGACKRRIVSWQRYSNDSNDMAGAVATFHRSMIRPVANKHDSDIRASVIRR